jgi:hypothetical protein
MATFWIEQPDTSVANFYGFSSTWETEYWGDSRTDRCGLWYGGGLNKVAFDMDVDFSSDGTNNQTTASSTMRLPGANSHLPVLGSSALGGFTATDSAHQIMLKYSQDNTPPSSGSGFHEANATCSFSVDAGTTWTTFPNRIANNPGDGVENERWAIGGIFQTAAGSKFHLTSITSTQTPGWR